MKSFFSKLIPLIVVVFFSLSTNLQAQYKVSAASGSISIDGTSTIHDWTETVESFTGTWNLEMVDGKISKISTAKIVAEVKSIKSGKSGMDDNTYKALKAKQHPQITYSLKSYAIQGSDVTLTGNLTIAGVTKTIKFTAKYAIVDGVINFKGSHTFKMTDFGIDPPTAVMGTIKTGDEVTVRFDLNFKK